MNGDLISREALKKTIEEYKYCGFYDKLIEIIDNAPSVEGFTKEDMSGAYNEGYACGSRENKRPQGEWIVTAEDNDGVHRICCPFCSYEKGSNNTDTIIVTFYKFPKFCERCGASMKGGAE